MQAIDAKEPRMPGEEFSRLRKLLEKSQKELARILGISRKAVESYEQGWRKVPVNTERMLYFLLFKLREPLLAGKNACWETRVCPDSIRQTCMTWLVKEGHYCWFFTGRLCAAKQSEKHEASASVSPVTHDTAGKSGNDLSFCRACAVFRGLTDLIKEPSGIIDSDSMQGREHEGATECP